MRVYRHTVAGEPVTVYFPTARDEAGDFLAWLAAQDQRPLGIDTETTGLDVFSRRFQVRLVQVGNRHEAWVLRADLFREAIVSALTRHEAWVVHNATFDGLVLDRTGLARLEEFLPLTTDTAILAHLLDPRGPQEGGVGRKLKALCSRFVDAEAPDTQDGLTEVFRKEYGATKSTGWAAIDVDHPTYVLYAGLDVILVSRLFEVLEPEVRARGFARLATFEHAVQYVTARLQRRGFLLDVTYTEKVSKDFLQQYHEAKAEAARLGVANVNSTAQVAERLQATGWTPTEFTPTGKPKVDRAILDGLAADGNALAVAVTDAKRARKWRTTYAESMLNDRDEGDRVHPAINALQARTARMSIAHPPLQQLPSKDWLVRRALVADSGHLIGGVDYQAVELRVLAALADVKRMKEAIANGEDLHGFTADLVYGPGAWGKAERSLMKGVGFGKVYGGGAETLARQTGAPLDKVQHAIHQYDRAYPEVGRYSRRLVDRARAGRREVETPSGRVLPLDRDRLYAATNYAVQSTARDVLAQALLDLDDAGLEPYLLLPVHDEVIFQAPAHEAEEVARAIGETMTMDFMGVPLTTDPAVYGPSWGSGYGVPAHLDAPFQEVTA